jgi:Glu-tRNA(Gln) amidotransferase subunit E-like FAD-binding protein
VNAKNSVLGLVALTTISGSALFGLNTASAQASGESLVAKISSAFSLSEEEVQTVFDDYRADKKESRQADAEEQLQGLVDDGTLTQEQKTQIEAHREEVRTLLTDLKDQSLDRETIKAAMKELHQEHKAWAEAEGIDLTDIKPEHKGRRGGGHFHQFDHDNHEEANEGANES